jgi:hypothetical protein
MPLPFDLNVIPVFFKQEISGDLAMMEGDLFNLNSHMH